MSRLIEIQDASQLRNGLSLAIGDVVWFSATGARLDAGNDAVRIVGILQQAVTGPAGEILAPAGPPNVVLVQAVRAGSAQIEIVTGDPWSAVRTTSVRLTVEG
ncbi:MAG: hypothetical protein JOZ54_24280 [Acidobacteria bacterium]|nr:hypothetical protein [Acidobacteriota bacterium]